MASWPHSAHANSQVPQDCYAVDSLDGKQKLGRPKVTWCSTFHVDLQWVDIRWKESEIIAVNHPQWRHLGAKCAQKQRRN